MFFSAPVLLITGAFINRGSSVSALDDKKLWNVTMKVKVGDKLEGGQIYATLPETPIIEHRLMVPPELSGEVVKVNPNGDYKLFDTVVVIKDDEGVEHNLTLCQQWPIRTSRPVKERLTSSVPLITGQRVIDTLFPIAKGGTAAIPARSARARPSFSTSLQSGATPISSSMSVAVSVVTR